MKILVILALISSSLAAQAQSQNAYAIGVDGVKAVEAGEFSKGLKILKQAWGMEPGEYDYPFEIGRAFYLKKEPKKAEKYLFPLQYHANVQPDLYILLADCYKQMNEQKKTFDETRKKELDALRYGIQKHPEAGMLYLEMGKRKVEMDENLDALSVFENGISNAPNFTENYFWAAKLMKASRNYVWAWIYAELFLNMSDNAEMSRTAARIVTESVETILSENWVAEPEQMDQELKILLSEKCKPAVEGVEKFVRFRECLLTEWSQPKFGLYNVLKRSEELQKQGYLDIYVTSTVLEPDKVGFLKWLAGKAERYEAYRKWRYYNPLMITNPIVRVP